MEDLVEYLNTFPVITRAAIALGIFVAANALFFPATVLSVACGFLLPLPLAIPIAMFARSITAVLCSASSRYLLRRWATTGIAERKNLAKIEQALSQEGWRGIVLLRLSPILPSGPSNYLLGLTRIPLPSIFLGTLVGTLPNTLLCTVAGSGLIALAEIRKFRLLSSQKGQILIVVGLLATALLVWRLWRIRSAQSKKP